LGKETNCLLKKENESCLKSLPRDNADGGLGKKSSPTTIKMLVGKKKDKVQAASSAQKKEKGKQRLAQNDCSTWKIETEKEVPEGAKPNALTGTGGISANLEKSPKKTSRKTAQCARMGKRKDWLMPGGSPVLVHRGVSLSSVRGGRP